ncbi:MAG: 4'-phosphopantetheinyl transferase superfamily protein [Oscillospiraceae bacterium]|nr:4'-phosphopantetheinyl transferase superfamily protein [Oscillospiraceae bacterium]
MSIYIVNASEGYEKITELMASALPEQRREQTDRLKQPSDRTAGVVGAYLVYYALIKGRPYDRLVYPEPDSLLELQVEVTRLAARLGWPIGGQGKPFPDGVQINGKHYHINISHSEGLIGAAISDTPVGIDIQRIPEISTSRLERISSRFHPLELERLRGLPEGQYASEFCRLWACKESVLKLCGKGLSLPLSSFRITPDDTCIIDSGPVKTTVYRLPPDAFLAVSVGI